MSKLAHLLFYANKPKPHHCYLPASPFYYYKAAVNKVLHGLLGSVLLFKGYAWDGGVVRCPNECCLQVN